MKIDVKKPERKLYKIRQLTELLGVTPRTIRYYDQFGLLPHVKRTSGNMRLFDDEDIQLIKKIRHMQKKEFLPLELIRERLFGGDDNTAIKMAVVSDNSLSLSAQICKQHNITLVPLDASVKDYEACYKKLAESGVEKIYSFHRHGDLSDSLANATKASNSSKVDVMLIDTKSIGGGHGIFVHKIGDAITQSQTQAQVDLLVSKIQPLMMDLVLVNGQTDLLGRVTSDTNLQSIISPKLLAFMPIIKFDKGKARIVDCLKSKTQAIELMLEEVQKEAVARGGFVRYISVTHSGLNAEAKEIGSLLNELYPRSEVELLKSNTNSLSNEAISIALM